MRNKALRRILCLCTAITFVMPILASAVDAMVVNMLSPLPSQRIEGRYVEVSVGFNTQSDLKVTKLELWVNGRFDQKKLLVQPKARGVVSFSWDSAAYGNGAHYLLVKLFGGADVIATVTGTGNVGVTPYDLNPPTIKFDNVKSGEVLSGVKQIKIGATDDSGAPPMVSVFVDQSLKLLKNTPPFTYDLDTTTYADGDHQIETYAYDNAGNQSNTASVKVKIRNSAATASAPAAPAAPTAPSATVLAKAETPAVAPAITAPAAQGAARVVEVKPKTTATAATTIAKATKPAPAVADTAKRVVIVSKPAPKPAVDIVVAAPKAEPVKVTPKPAVVVAPKVSQPVKVAATVAKPIAKPVAKVTAKPIAPKVVQLAKVDLESSTITRVMIGKPAMPEAAVAAKPVVKPAASIVITEKPIVAKPAAVKPVASVKPVATHKPSVVISEKPTPKPAVVVAAKPAPKRVVVVSVKPAAKLVVAAKTKAPVKMAKAVVPVTVLTTVAPAPKPVAKVVVPAPAKKTVVAFAPKRTEKVVGEGVKLRTVIKSAEKASLRTASSQLPSAGRIKMRDLVNKSSGTVLWDSKTKTVTAYVNNIKIELRIGHNLVKVNGKVMKVSLVPYIQNGRTIVDVRLYHRALALAAKTSQKTAQVPAK